MLGLFLTPDICPHNNSNPAQEGHTKYVQMPEHHIHEVVEFGEIQLFYVPTDQQFTDIFMKNLDKTKFQDRRNALCLQRYSLS